MLHTVIETPDFICDAGLTAEDRGKIMALTAACPKSGRTFLAPEEPAKSVSRAAAKVKVEAIG